MLGQDEAIDEKFHGYILPCYEPLHSQDKDYIIEDIKQVMRERGLLA